MNYFRCLDHLHCRQAVPTQGQLCQACRRALAASLHPRGLGPERVGNLAVYLPAEDAAPWSGLIRQAKSQAWGLWQSPLEDIFCRVTQHWAPELAALRPDALVWVPASPWRALRQTDLAAQCALWMSQALKVPALPLLKRRFLRLGRAQKTLSLLERRQTQTQEGTWAWNGSVEAAHLRQRGGRRILLVDDLCVTGSSLLKARLFLKRHGYETVGAWVLARRR